ncbi:MAG: YicC/YloC family endoribonuclease [Gammaproteobacteria bacterium]|jgi:uncharacterized protein (TIGR00255 family)
MAEKNKVSSMTAFAQSHVQNELGTLTGELRAVNSRFFELNLRLPEILRGLEMQIREILREKLTRGKIDLGLRFEATGDNALNLNKNLIHTLLESCQSLSKNAQTPVSINMMDVLRWPGAVITSEQNQKQLEQAALNLVKDLLTKFQQNREREGSALQQVIIDRLEKIAEHVHHIKPHAAQIMQYQREKLLERVKQTQIEFDSNRLEQELVFWAHKSDIAEEIDRLQTHIKEIQNTFKDGGPLGRRLDFLVQELHREANTLGSKALTSDITYHAVEIKVLIEQIREQVQNLE